MHRFDYSIHHFITCIRGTHIVVTPDLISKVLHIPKVAHPDYPGYDCLQTMSKDKLSSLFCETPYLGVTAKTLIAESFQKVSGSLTW